MRAEAFYLSSAEAIASVAQKMPEEFGIAAYWAVAEAQALDEDAWGDLPRLAQGPGNLGTRMAHVYRLLLDRYGSALLVAADAPQLDRVMLSRAVRWLSLSGPRLVVGPTHDGDFWIFGGNTHLPEQAWIDATSARPGPFKRIFSAMQNHGDWLVLNALTNFDREVDLELVCTELLQIDAPTDAQRSLMEWLEDWLSLKSLTP